MKKAFTLIELIIAIIVMAIAIAALPRMVSQTQKSNAFALKQELIFQAKSQLTSIMKLPWDSAGYVVNKPTPIFVTNTTDTNISSDRPGILEDGGRLEAPRKYITITPERYDATKQDEFGKTTKSRYESIDDYNDAKYNIKDDFNLNSGLADQNDFITDANVSVSVRYFHTRNIIKYDAKNISVDFSKNQKGSDSTDIKQILVTVVPNSKDSDVNVTMSTFSFNIGETPIPSKF